MFNFLKWLSRADHSYSCVMAMLDSKNRRKFVSFASNRISPYDLYIKGEDFGIEEETHVTALYGLHTENPDLIKKLISDVNPFNIELGKITKFHSEDFDVLKVDVISPHLTILNSRLKKLPYTSKHKVYHPHVTLAYVKKGTCEHMVDNDYFYGTAKIDSIVFSTPGGTKTRFELDKHGK